MKCVDELAVFATLAGDPGGIAAALWHERGAVKAFSRGILIRACENRGLLI
jgi:hypothetical protein